MPTLRRTVIIRESDMSTFTRGCIKKKLYDRMDFEALTYKELQQENMVNVLKGESHPQYRVLPDVYEDMLWREKSLYDRRYLNWHFSVDYPLGQIYVSSKVDRPREALYRVILEKDFD